MNRSGFADVLVDAATAIEQTRRGRILIVTDDEGRENEGDLVLAAERVTPEAVNFMARHARGLLCQAITAQRARELDLEPMTRENTSAHATAFTVSVDARGVTTTGISAFDRAATIGAVIDPGCLPEDLLRPGHVFPLVAKDGGVLARAGHTEAAVDLARMAGLYPSGILCEVLDDDGTMARLPRLALLARRHGLRIVTVAELAAYRRRVEPDLVRRTGDARLPTEVGEFRLVVYESALEPGLSHFALVKGEPHLGAAPLVRVHSECLTGESLLSARCDCGFQLRESMRRVQAAGSGVIVYLRQEGRGIGFANKVRAYRLQDEGVDTVEANLRLGLPADARDYTSAARILQDLGISSVQLLTNNPAKIAGLRAGGIEVVERIPLEVGPGRDNRAYLATKKERCGHLLAMTGG